MLERDSQFKKISLNETTYFPYFMHYQLEKYTTNWSYLESYKFIDNFTKKSFKHVLEGPCDFSLDDAYKLVGSILKMFVVSLKIIF